MGDSSFPWLAANVFDSASGRARVGGAVSDDRGRRQPVAVVGYVTPGHQGQPGRGADSRPPVRRRRAGSARCARRGPAGEARADHRARARRAACERSRSEGELVRLAEELRGSGVDLVVGGNGAQAVETRIGGISVVSGAGARLARGGRPGEDAGGGLAKSAPGVSPVTGGGGRAGTPLAAALDTFARRSDSLARRAPGPAQAAARPRGRAARARRHGRRGAAQPARERTSAWCGTRRSAPIFPPGR